MSGGADYSGTVQRRIIDGMPAHGDILPALLMLLVTVVALAAVFVFLLKRAAKHAAPHHEEGMTHEPWNDGKSAFPDANDRR